MGLDRPLGARRGAGPNLKNRHPGKAHLADEDIMADKEIVFSDQEQQKIQAIVIDKDKDEAIRYLAGLRERIKGQAAHACGFKPARG